MSQENKKRKKSVFNEVVNNAVLKDGDFIPLIRNCQKHAFKLSVFELMTWTKMFIQQNKREPTVQEVQGHFYVLAERFRERNESMDEKIDELETWVDEYDPKSESIPEQPEPDPLFPESTVEKTKEEPKNNFGLQ